MVRLRAGSLLRLSCLALLSLCLLLPVTALGAQILRLDAKTWNCVPGGREVDAIYGDYLLRSNQLLAVVADTVSDPFRMGNTMQPDARGMLLDLTTRANNNDQLQAFLPAKGGQEVTYSQAEVITRSGPEVRLRVTHPAVEAEPYLVETDYVLADNRPFVTIFTRVRNTSQIDRNWHVGDKLRTEGNFGQGLAPLSRAYWAYDRWAQAAYAVLPDEGTFTTTPTTGRENGMSLGYTRLGSGNSVTIAPGAELTWSRRLLAARDQLQLQAALLSLESVACGTRQVQVQDRLGVPIAGAQVTVRQAERQLASGATDSRGQAQVSLPPGQYTLTVTNLGRPEVSQELEITANASASPTVVQMARPAGVEVQVVGEDGREIPCKVQFLAVTPGLSDPELGPGCVTFGVKNLRYTETGSFRQALPPGAYNVIISRGPEYDAVYRHVQVISEQFAPIWATLRRVIDTRGVIAADLHGHTSESGDNFVEVTGRVLNLAAEGIEFAPSTDHVRIVPWQPAIDQLHLGRWLKTTLGEEISGPGAQTHENAFPLPMKLHSQANGGIPAGGDLDAQVSRIYHWNHDSEKLVQFNHPDLRRAYFDKDSDGKFDGGFREAQRYIDAVEAMGNPLAAKSNFASNWLAVLNQGFRLTGVANTDTHTTFHGNGLQRNYIECSTDDPRGIGVLEMVRQGKAGHVVMSTGPYMEVRAGTAHPGDDLSAPDGKVRLHVRVQCANWVDINRVQVLVNGRPDPALNLTRRSHPRAFSRGVVRFDREIPVTLSGDAHLVVVAVGEGLTLAPVMGGRKGGGVPLAVSNPIYVDVDGGGFKANGDALGLAKGLAERTGAAAIDD